MFFYHFCKRHYSNPPGVTRRSWRQPTLRLGLAATLAAQVAGTCLADTPGHAGSGISLPAFGKLEADREDRRQAGKSHLIPALDIVGFDILLSQINRHTIDSEIYGSDLSSIRDNLQRGWTTENDPYYINQIAHPYQGSMYHGFARSAGLNYWESSLYTFAGSAFWEIAGETTRPSKNDQVASGIAGSFLGEPLFRMANLLLEQGHGRPGFWREVAAAAISPSTGFNRLAFGDRFDTPFDSHDPACYGRLQLGSSGTLINQQGPATRLERAEVIADYSLDYGLPGKPGYAYRRPFDHFSFQITGTTGNGVESLTSHGLLLGTGYAGGDALRGVWGLYGSFDYIAPQLFRVSSTALSIGSTAQLRLPKEMALQGSALLGAGYAAAGTLNPTDQSDYHYGVAPQGMLSLRMIFGERASLDLNAREYFVSSVGSSRRKGRDNIARADISLTIRVHGRHAISLKYLWSQRDASLRGQADFTQTRATLGIFYTLLGSDRFGRVDY